MPNRSYLCGTNLKTTYPSFVDPNYDSARQTIANDAFGVPLLWSGLFRAADLVSHTFDVDGEKIATQAPLVERTKGVQQLREAGPYFSLLFQAEGSLHDYVAFLLSEVEQAPFDYLTIELQEIAEQDGSPEEFFALFQSGLRTIGYAPEKGWPQAKEWFLQQAAFRELERFPPARLLVDKLEGSDNDFWNHCRVCGAGSSVSGIGRSVAWEPT